MTAIVLTDQQDNLIRHTIRRTDLLPFLQELDASRFTAIP